MKGSKRFALNDKPAASRHITFGPFDPRNPTRSLLTIVLVMLFLGWLIWVLVSWPGSIGFFVG